MRKNKKLTKDEITATLKALNSATNEHWKYINYGYYLSDKGRLYNSIQRKLEKPDFSTGQARYNFFCNYKGCKILLHRLLVCYFGNGTPEMLFNLDFECHHINQDHHDNSISNLLMLPKTYGLTT